jgi:hypothetical protein
MAEREPKIAFTEAAGCCPSFIDRPLCDTLDFRYRLPFQRYTAAKQALTVDVVLHFRLTRCSMGLVLGDPVYSITLMPGEQVRLFTSDRHTRWSYDSESSMTYRHETTSVESFFTAGMARAMSDLTINESGVSTSSYSESWAEGGGGLEISILGIVNLGGGGGGGSYDASSLSAFTHSLSRHAECASSYVATSVRAKSAVSIGEVERRTHAEGESEAQYESASRIFSNPNKCRAVTYLFYQINKLQQVRFSLERIERRIEDPAAPTGAYQRVPADITGRVTVLPQAIPATSTNRLDIEDRARRSAMARQQEALSAARLAATTPVYGGIRMAAPIAISRAGVFDSKVREDIIKEQNDVIDEVDGELVDKKILDAKTRELSEEIKSAVAWQKEEILPTPGVIVKGCLDDCETCEPALQREVELDLERKHLDNEMLKRQTELLEKAQEYRCCPVGSAEEEEPPGERAGRGVRRMPRHPG